MPTTLDPIPPAYAVERRRHRRIEASVTVELSTSGSTLSARLKELSQRGARIESGDPLTLDAPVVLRRNGVSLAARVVWAEGEAAGLEFMLPLDPKDFLQLRRGLAANL